MGGTKHVDWDIEAEVALASGGDLTFDRIRRLLIYAPEGRDQVSITVTEADLRNWMQVLLLSSFTPTAEVRAPRMAVQLILELAHAHVERGEDPFTPLRARLARIAKKQAPLAG